MSEYGQFVTLAKEIAKEAGDIMLHYFRSEAAEVVAKSDKTLVTKADLEINQMVIERIKANYPTHSVHGEEASHKTLDAPYTWVCDPIDGTFPFAKGLPISSFSLGIVRADGVSIVGVVFDPYQARMYEAELGRGAFLNGKQLRVSGKADLDRATVDNELWQNKEEGVSFIDPRPKLEEAGLMVTSVCSAVITGCLVAEGTYDAMIFGQSKPEDIAALKVIVEEAGGKVTSLTGQDQRYDQKIYGAIVSNGHIHSHLVDIVSTINYESKYVAKNENTRD